MTVTSVDHDDCLTTCRSQADGHPLLFAPAVLVADAVWFLLLWVESYQQRRGKHAPGSNLKPGPKLETLNFLNPKSFSTAIL